MPPAPAVHATTERLWLAIGRAYYGPDEAEGTGHQWHLLSYLDAVGRLLGAIDDLVRDTDDGPGWSGVFDVDRTPAAHLAYLAQYIGVRGVRGLPEVEARARVSNAENQRRGTPQAITDAIAMHLTGSKSVLLTERDTSAYHFLVRTYASETPDQPAVQAEIERQKPAGLQFAYAVMVSGTLDQLGVSYATVDDVGAAFATMDDLDNYVP